MFRKGQITVFVIIGIVILVFVGVVFLYQTLKDESSWDLPTDQIEIVSEDQRNVIDSVDSCLMILALDGLEIMRVQAGYISIPNIEAVDVRDDFRNAVVIDSGIKHVEYSGSSRNSQPYWITKDDLFVPSIQKMEYELSSYISSNIMACLGNLDSFREQGIELNVDHLRVDVNFDQGVLVDMEMPIHGSSDGIDFSMDTFRYFVPVNMKKISELSTSIAFGEQREAFLEYFAMDLLSKYSYLGGSKGPDDIPPLRFTDVNLDCDMQSWTIDEVESTLKRNFFFNHQYVQLANVDHEIPSGPLSSVYDTYVYTPFPGNFDDVDVDFFFDPDLAFDLSISPGGSVLKPEKTMTTSIPLLPMFCTYKYRFKYDMEYPVIVRVTDKSSARIDAEHNIIDEDGGFTFSFPVWVHICGNQKRLCNYKDYSYDRSVFSDILSDSSSINIDNVLNSASTSFCDIPQGEDLTIFVHDSLSNYPVKNVQVGYYGGNFDNDCLLGSTDEEGKLVTRFPYCSGCIIYLTRYNYSERFERFDVIDGMDDRKRFVLEPQLEYNVIVKLVYLPVFMSFWTLHNINAGPSRTAQDIGLDNTAVSEAVGRSITGLRETDLMQLVPLNLGVSSLTDDIAVIISGDGPTSFSYISSVAEPGANKIMLSPGEYSFTYSVFGQVVVDPSEVDDGQGGKVTVSMNPPFSIGTYNGDWALGSYSGTFEIKREDMFGKSAVVLYVPVNYLPDDIHEVLDLQKTIIRPDRSLERNDKVISRQDFMPYIYPVFE
ncbi:MAG: hypothetical protein V1740_00190 [Candidatus Woesearchaeota archaeon]